MIIDRKDRAVVRFRLEPQEWRLRNGKVVTDFLHELRATVPLEFREYDAETCTYVIDRAYFDGTVGRLRERYFGEVNT